MKQLNSKLLFAFSLWLLALSSSFAQNTQLSVGTGINITNNKTGSSATVVHTGGILSNAGSVFLGNANLKITGTTAFSTANDFSVKDLSITAGTTTLSNSVDVGGQLSIANGASLAMGTNGIVLGSDATLANNGSLTGTLLGLRTATTSTLVFGSSTATLSTNVSGSSMQYQWQTSPDGTNGWTNIASASSASYVANAAGYYRCKLNATTSTYQQFTPAQQISSIPADRFVLQYTYNTGSQSSISFNALTVGDVAYTYTSSLGKSGSGTFNQATLANFTISTGAIANGEVFTVVIEPTNLRQFQAGNSNSFLTDVAQWGSVAWTSMNQAFNNCSKLNITASDVPNLSGVSDMGEMFKGCSILTGPANIGTWSTSTVTNMFSMFENAAVFNQPIGNWNTSAVINMSRMFRVASAFNQNINYNVTNSTWNTSLVTNMVNMFDGASAFNQPIGAWITSEVTDMRGMFLNATSFNQPIGTWNTSAVTDLSNMFRGAIAFNQNISDWNVSKAITLQRMFSGASAFNQNIGKWNLTAVTNLAEMLNNCGMNCANYSATLVDWAANLNTPNNLSLGATGRTYGTDAVAARTKLDIDKNWTFTGDAASATACIPAPILSTIPNQATCDGESITDIAITLSGDIDGLTLAATSSNAGITGLGFTFGGSGANRTLSITTTAGQVGATTISVIATNSAGGKDTTEFLLELGNKSTNMVWTAQTAPSSDWYSMAYGNGIYVALAQYNTPRVMTSPDGITWTARTAVGNVDWSAVTFANGRFVAVGQSPPYGMTSTDGINWVSTPVGGSGWQDITYGNGLFVAVAENSNKISTSPDGLNWTFRTEPSPNEWRGITYANGQFVAVGRAIGNQVMTSPDGINWTARTSAPSAVLTHWQSVAYGNGVYVAVGYLGTTQVMTSPDGITWTARTPTQSSGWESVTFADGIFVAVSSGGLVMTSPDGITWTARTPAAGAWTAVTYANGQFVAVAFSGTNRVMTSPGITTTYTPCNAKPTFTATSMGALANDTLCLSASNQGRPVRQISVSDPDGSIVSTVVSSSNPALVTASNSGTNTNVSITPNVQANQSGTATIKVVSTDNLGAKDSVSFVIKVNAVAIDSTTGANVLCHGQSTGSLTVTPTGGTAPYTYQWTTGGSPTGSNNPSLTGLSAGTYNVTVTDKFFCSANRNLVISQPAAPLTLSKDSSNITCYENNDGTAKVTPAGGTAPYSYAWNQGLADVTASVTGLGALTYIATVTDANGCKATASFNIFEPAEIVINTQPMGLNPVCEGEDTLLIVGATGGNLSYQWFIKNPMGILGFPLMNDANHQGVSNDTLTFKPQVFNNTERYFVRVSQSPTCFKESNQVQVIAEVCNTAPTITALSNQEVCSAVQSVVQNFSIDDAEDNTTLSVTATSANTSLIPNANITLGGSGLNRTVRVRSANGQSGTALITVTVTDAGNLSSTSTFSVLVNPRPVITSLTDPKNGQYCIGEQATLRANPTGGTWNSNDGNIAFIHAVSGALIAKNAGVVSVIYTYTNGNGCTVSKNTTITVNSLPQLSNITGPNKVCVGEQITLGNSYTGGTWSTSDNTIASIDASTGLVTGISNGSVLIAYSAGNTAGCSASKSTSITVNAKPVVTAITGATAVCKDASIQLANTTAGGTWASSMPTIASVDASGKVQGLAVGASSISYTVENTAGCVTTVSQSVHVDALPIGAAIMGDLTLCAGKTGVLTNATEGGVWSSESPLIATVNAASGAISALSEGEAIINYTLTNAANCSISKRATAIVNPSPSVAAITGAADVCVGKQSTFTNTTQGGTWSTSNNTIATISATGVLTAQSAGSVTVRYALTNAFVCTTLVEKTVMIQALPTLNLSGVSSLCLGNTSTFTADQTGGVWASSNPSVASVDQEGKVSALAAGTASISYIYTNSYGCEISKALSLTVNTAASLSLPESAAICQDAAPITLVASPQGGSFSGDGIVNGVLTPSTLSVGNHVYTYSYTNANNCVSTASFTLTIKALPSVSISQARATICQGETSVLSANNTNLASYQWSFEGNTLVDATSATYQANQSGSYSLKVSDNGCFNSASISLSVQALPNPTITYQTTGNLCQNEAINLNAGSYASYQWYLNGEAIQGASNQFQVATTAGSYTVKVSDGLCEALSAAVSISANADVPITSTSSPAICVGASVVLNTTAFASYQWQKDGLDIPGATSASYSANSAGSYRVAVSDANGCSATSAAIVVNVNSLPSAAIKITGNPTICENEFVKLTATENYPSYQWYINGVLEPGLVDQQIYGRKTGSYSVAVRDANGCGSTSATASIVVNKLPNTALTTAEFEYTCVNQPRTLSAVDQSGKSYQWFRNEQLIAGATGKSISTNENGKYYVQITSQQDCDVNTATTRLVVFQLPLKPIVSASKDSLTSSTATNYQWFINDTLVVGATTQSIAVSKNGIYTVATLNEFGCENRSDAFVVDFIAVTELESYTISGYPNPVNATYFVESSSEANYVLFDLNGRKLQEGNLSKGVNSINMTDYAQGMYQLQIMQNDATVKVLKVAKN